MNETRNEERLRRIRESLERLKQEEKQLLGLSPTQIIADEIHTLMCHWNHTDGCGWEYESWSQPGWSRMQYINKALELLKVVDFEQAKRVVGALRVQTDTRPPYQTQERQ